MPIPDFQSFLLPLLESAGDGKEHSLREAREALANKFDLSEEDRRTLLPSGQQRVFDNRVAWAKAFLKAAGLIQTTKRAHFTITPRGVDVLKDSPPKLTVKFLKRFPEFKEFYSVKTPKTLKDDDETSEPITPHEVLEKAHQELRNELSGELMEQVKSCDPGFFEKLVIDLLLKMGYGGSKREAAEAVGGVGDGGIDGIINEDKLGLDAIYIQAKRWEGQVGKPEIQKFVGALDGQKATKGVFITTSGFSKGARDYISIINKRVVLIDGPRLAELMIDYGLGVSTKESYEVKEIDIDYFSD